MRDQIVIAELTWPEVRDAIAAGSTRVVFACGSTEQHGPHLPLAVDSLIGTAIAVEVAHRMRHSLVAPTIAVGCSEHHMSFPGTLTLSEKTFGAVVDDYCRSLARHGFAEICVIPSHGGNFRPVAEAVASMRHALPDGVAVAAYTDLLDYVETWRRVIQGVGGPADHVGGHADIAETSMILALRPELVRESGAEPGYHGDLAAVLPTIWERGFAAVTSNGILGDPRGMSGALGEALIAGVSARIADDLERQFAERADGEASS